MLIKRDLNRRKEIRINEELKAIIKPEKRRANIFMLSLCCPHSKIFGISPKPKKPSVSVNHC